MDEILFSTAAQLAAGIRARKVSSVEVVDAHLGQIARHNAALNAIVTLDEDRARRRAKEADEALARGEDLGSLHGVPVTIKDFHAVAGLRCTSSGRPQLADHIAQEDSAVPARLKAAGAVILGISNMYFKKDSIFGPSSNPWDLERTPGTSSSGATAALAAGLTPLDVGSDLSGSITVPAHYGGIFGMRPTEHRVSLAGIVDTKPVFIWRALNVLGPMARSVDDLRLTLRIISGPDKRNPDAPPVPWRDTLRPLLKDLRIAWMPTFPGMKIRQEIRDAVGQLANELDQLGACVEQRLPEVDLDGQIAVFWKLFHLLYDSFEDEPAPIEDYLTGMHRRDGFIAIWETFFESWDALLCPVFGITAPRHDATLVDVDGEQLPYSDVGGPYLPFCLTGHPAVVIPLSRDADGLPFGAMLVGKRWHDEELLNIAEIVSELTGGFHRPPGY